MNIDFNTASFLNGLMGFDSRLNVDAVVVIGQEPAFRFWWGSYTMTRNEYVFTGADCIEDEHDLANFDNRFAGACQTFSSMMESKEARDIEYCRSLASELYTRYGWSQSKFPSWWSWDTSELRDQATA